MLIGTMAAAWHGGFNGTSAGFINNSTLLNQISTAMDWWFARDFTQPDCLDNGGAGACPCGTPGAYFLPCKVTLCSWFIGLWNTNWFSNVRISIISETPNLTFLDRQSASLAQSTKPASSSTPSSHLPNSPSASPSPSVPTPSSTVPPNPASSPVPTSSISPLSALQVICLLLTRRV